MPTHANITLSNKQWQWLDRMVAKYELPDPSTAICACVDCVMVVVGDVAIPPVKIHIDPDTATSKLVDLSPEQITFLGRHVDLGDGASMVCQVVEACMNNSDEWLVFGPAKNKHLKTKHPEEAALSMKITRESISEPVVGGSNNTSQVKKKSYTEVPFILTQAQWEWLGTMASKHKLPDMSKAVRCCVNCVALEETNNVQSTAQELDQSTAHNDEEGVMKNVELSNEQLAWLETKRKENGDGVARRMVQSCMAMEEYTVFGIIRCKSSIAKCEGAQNAVKNIGDQYGKAEDEVVVKENIDILAKDCGCESNSCKDNAANSGDNKKTKGAYQKVSIALNQQQWEWLDDMASKHKLSSMSKAARCCITCVALGDAKNPSSSSNIDACVTNCGITKEVELSDEQIAWFESQEEAGEKINFFSQHVIAPCMAMDEYAVFGIIRCKKSISKCEGAEEALQNIGEQYGKKEEDIIVKENVDILSKKCGSVDPTSKLN